MAYKSGPHISILEVRWGALVMSLTVWSLLAVGLAHAGFFRGWALGIAGIIAGIAGWGFLRAGEQAVGCGRKELLFLALLVALGILLFGWPAEHFPLLGDSAIYPNTAALLIRTGGLAYNYEPLEGLTRQQKQLFYIPSDRQLPYIQIKSYQGLLYGAYYVLDPDRNLIVSSRPPAMIAWMGLFGMVLGEQGMLYVTPLFGTLSLIALYFLAKRSFNARTGAMAALWLLVSFPQLHFSRTSYAEIVGQFFVLSAIYALIIYLQTARIIYNLLGIMALTAAFSARIDVIISLFSLLAFFCLLFLRKDWKGCVAGTVSLIAMGGVTAWTVNRPYVGATVELLLAGQLRFLRQWGHEQILIIGTLFSLLLVLAFSIWRWKRTAFLGLVRWGFSVGVLLGIVYSLHVRPLFPETVVARGQVLRTYDEEIMAVTARYVGPTVFWLAALGLVCMTWQRKIRHEQMILALFTVSFGSIFFWKYTTAKVYPVALRRLVPEVLPGLSIFAAFFLDRIGGFAQRRWVALALMGLNAVWPMSVAGPYWFYPEASGTWNFLNELAARLSDDAIILFEPQHDESVVGWFAAPLWSFYGHRALLINSDNLDWDAFQSAICFWKSRGMAIYVISQREIVDWWPMEFDGIEEGMLRWNSSIIGQSRLFPPYIWRFTIPFHIYILDNSGKCGEVFN